MHTVLSVCHILGTGITPEQAELALAWEFLVPEPYQSHCGDRLNERLGAFSLFNDERGYERFPSTNVWRHAR